MHIESTSIFLGGRRDDPFVSSGRPTMGSSSLSGRFSSGDRPSTIKARGVPAMNLKPAMPGGKRAIAKVPSMKRSNPAIHMERAKAGIRVQQESDQSVLDKMKRDACFHIEYFYPGVDDDRKMEVPMKDMALAPSFPIDPANPDGPKETVIQRLSKQMDAREASASRNRDVGNADAREEFEDREFNKAVAQRFEKAKTKFHAAKDERAALHESNKARETGRKERRDIARYASDVIRAGREPGYVGPATPAEYNQPKHQRQRAVAVADAIDHRIISQGGNHNDPAAIAKKKQILALTRAPRHAPGTPAPQPKAEPAAPPPNAAELHKALLNQARHTGVEGFWDPPDMDEQQRKRTLGNVISAIKKDITQKGGKVQAIVNVYRKAHRDEVKQTGTLAHEHLFRALNEALRGGADLTPQGKKRPKAPKSTPADGSGPSTSWPRGPGQPRKNAWDADNIPYEPHLNFKAPPPLGKDYGIPHA